MGRARTSPQSRPRTRRSVSRKARWFVVQALVSGVLLVLLVRRLDVDAFLALFRRLPFWSYLLSFTVVLAGQIAYAWRWRLLLVASGVRVGFSIVVRQYFIGIFMNNFLPSTVGGDLAKVYLLGRDCGYRKVTASVVLDRVLGLGLLSLFAAGTLWSLSLSSAVLVAARLAVTGVAAASLILLWIVAWGTGGLPDRVSWMGTRAVGLARRLQQLRVEMAATVTLAVTGQAAVIVIGYFVAVGGVYVLLITLLTGLAPPFGMTLGVAMTASVLSNVPISVNGLGVREQLHVTLFAPLGVSSEAAVAISLLLFGQMVITSLLGLVCWMQVPTRPADAVERAAT